MLAEKCVAAMLVFAGLTTVYSPCVRSQTVQAGTVVGSQTSDDVPVRPKLEIEIARLKAQNQLSAGTQKKPDQVKIAIKAAQTLLQDRKYVEALAKLSDLDALSDKTAEESYLIERTRVALASSLKDDVLLVKSLEATLASGRAPADERQEFDDQLVRKYFNQKNFAKTIAWATRYFEDGGKDAAIRRALVFSYYLNNDFARARQEVTADIQAAEAAGKTPPEEQLRLLVSCAQKLDDKAAYASATEKYAAYYPKKP